MIRTQDQTRMSYNGPSRLTLTKKTESKPKYGNAN